MAAKQTETPILIPFLWLTAMGILAIFAYNEYEQSYILENVGALLFALPVITFWGFLFLRANWKENFFMCVLWTLILVAAPIYAYHYYTHQIPENFPPKAGLRVATYNVNYFNGSEESVNARLNVIKQLNADVISVVEGNTMWSLHLGTLKDTYPYSFTAPEQPNRGTIGRVILMSKYPILESTLLNAGHIVHHKIQLAPEQIFNIVQVHAMPPLNRALVEQRSATFDALETELPADNLMIMGDFNSVPWQNDIQHLVQTHNLIKASGIKPTWPAVMPVAPIDHILVSKPAYSVDSKRLCFQGSDHCLVYTDVINYLKNVEKTPPAPKAKEAKAKK